MNSGPILVTGFEPYGGRGINPAYESMRILNGRRLSDLEVAGRALPVSLKHIQTVLDGLLDELQPVAVICLGLWPGEAMIRLERIGVNIADFEIPDNDQAIVRDSSVSSNGRASHLATLPLRAIEAALLTEGIPARISSTAGTFLCNACLFTVLDYLAARAPSVPAGFIHLPYIPEQVAAVLRETRDAAVLELHQRADIASMELTRIVRAIEIAIETTIQSMQSHQGRTVC
jgi:pyroglutamyl-peptidase